MYPMAFPPRVLMHLSEQLPARGSTDPLATISPRREGGRTRGRTRRASPQRCAANDATVSLPLPTPEPPRISSRSAASSSPEGRAFSKVHLLTFKPSCFHAGVRVMQSDKPGVSLDSGRILFSFSNSASSHQSPLHKSPRAAAPASKSISIFQIQRLFCLKNEAALHRGNREINTGYIEFPSKDGGTDCIWMIVVHPDSLDSSRGWASRPGLPKQRPCKRAAWCPPAPR